MKKSRPNQKISEKEMYISKFRTPKLRENFDSGPGEKYAKLLKNLKIKKLFKVKDGKTLKANGVDALYVQSHPNVGDFGHYRGSFKKIKAFILADPDGYDDLITARALTGTRGQYLQGLMQDLGIGSQYLILKTVPVGMDGATEEDWTQVLSITKKWREKLVQEILSDNSPILVLSDGKNAQKELQRILGEQNNVFHIKKEGLANESGIVEVGQKIVNILPNEFSGKNIHGKMHNIPRSHLTYYARVWEGTSGDRVITALDKMKGLAFLTVAPHWVAQQKFNMSDKTKKGIETLKKKLKDNLLPFPDETIPDYLERRYPIDLAEGDAA